jgi:ABC-2 type transport system ATP-binding protein
MGDAPAPAAVLECRDLRKSFGTRAAVDGVSFTIGPSETYGLLGPNGAGKTTTISMICGLLVRDGGSVRVAGQPIDVDAVQAKRSIGYVPQELAIYPELTARENLRFFGQLHGLGGAELRRRTDEVLTTVGLADRANERTDAYSGGMKRRLNIGIGLLNEPQLLVLDEPTVGVDPQSRNAILASVEELGRQGMAILYTTHYMEEAERLCDRVGIIDAGSIKAEGTRRELIGLIGERDRVDLTAAGDLARAADALRGLDVVDEATVHDGGVALLVHEARTALPRLIETAAAAGASIAGVEIVEPDLEAVFLHVTGRALRD